MNTVFWEFIKKKPKFLLAMAIIAGIFVLAQISGDEEIVTPETVTKEKTVETVTFGQWEPDKFREVLGTVESDRETTISAEVSGQVDQIFVKIGDFVRQGQVLATLRTQDDRTQIGFENATRNLETTRISAGNSVRAAEIAVETAKRDLAQTKLTEKQNHEQALETLKTRSRNSETLISNILNWLDRILGASEKYRYEQATGRHEIGAQDRIGKQNTKNTVEDLVRKVADLEPLPMDPRESEIYNFARNRLEFLREVKDAAELFDHLIHGTLVTTDFSETTLDTFKAQSATYLDKLNAEILALESQIETTKSGTKRMNLALASGENRIRNAEASLELARSNSKAQISGAESQYLLAQSSQRDLSIRAPFAGQISEKMIAAGNQISIGQSLFSVVNESTGAKVSAFLTSEEMTRIRQSELIKLRFENGTEIVSPQKFASVRIDPRSQKVRIEFPLTSLPEGVLVGSFVKVLLPLNGEHQNLLPISSISFEPDGAEVLVIENGVATRKKIQTGEIIGSAMEVLLGLDKNVPVIRFRNRAFSGEKVAPMEK